jgi:hypothetical protein
MFVAQARPVSGSTHNPTAFPQAGHEDPLSRAVRADERDCRASRIFFLAGVAARADRQQQVATRQHGDRPRDVRSTPWQSFDQCAAVALSQVVAQGHLEELRLAGDEQGAGIGEGDRVRPLVAVPDLDRLVRGPVSVAVRQRNHAICSALRHEQDAVRREGHEAGRPQAGREECGLHPLWDDELRPPARARVEAHAGEGQQPAAEGPGQTDDDEERQQPEERQVPDVPHQWIVDRAARWSPRVRLASGGGICPRTARNGAFLLCFRLPMHDLAEKRPDLRQLPTSGAKPP